MRSKKSTKLFGISSLKFTIHTKLQVAIPNRKCWISKSLDLPKIDK